MNKMWALVDAAGVKTASILAGAAHTLPAWGVGHPLRWAVPPWPVLIYGTGARGHLARLIELARKPWPLPLGLCRNRRSLLARENLIGAIHFVLAQPLAKGETYIVADPTPLTLAEIVGAIRAGQGRRPRLLPVPPALIALGAQAIGRADEWERLGGSHVVDPGKLLHAGWKPTVDTAAGLRTLAHGRISLSW